MSTGNNIKNFTAIDIEKYHKGLLSAKEQHELEKAALDDPFLADALEGYALPGTNATDDIAELKSRLAEKLEKGKLVTMGSDRKTSFPWLRIAAMLILVAGAALLVYQFAFNTKKDNIANLEPKNAVNKVATDSSRPAQPITTENSSTAPTTDEQRKDKPSPGLVKNEDRLETASGKGGTVGETKSDSASAASSFYKFNTNTVTTAPAKPVDEKVNGDVADLKKNNRNDNAAKEEAKLKTGSDDTKREAAGSGIISPAANQALENRTLYNNQKAINQQYNTNVFRGRVTDAGNNGLPFASPIFIRHLLLQTGDPESCGSRPSPRRRCR